MKFTQRKAESAVNTVEKALSDFFGLIWLILRQYKLSKI